MLSDIDDSSSDEGDTSRTDCIKRKLTMSQLTSESSSDGDGDDHNKSGSEESDSEEDEEVAVTAAQLAGSAIPSNHTDVRLPLPMRESLALGGEAAGTTTQLDESGTASGAVQTVAPQAIPEASARGQEKISHEIAAGNSSQDLRNDGSGTASAAVQPTIPQAMAEACAPGMLTLGVMSQELTKVRGLVAELTARIEELERSKGSSADGAAAPAARKAVPRRAGVLKGLLKKVYKVEVLRSSMSNAMNRHCTKEIMVQKKEVEDVVASIMYTSEINPKRSEFNGGVSEMYATFRGIALQNLVQGLKDAYPYVERDAVPVVEEGTPGSEKKDITIHGFGFPKLMSMIVDQDIADAHEECLGGKTALRRRKHFLNDLTIELCKQFAVKTGAVLRDGRRAARTGYTRSVGYMYWDWEQRASLIVWSDDHNNPNGRIPVCKVREIEDAPGAELAPEDVMKEYVEFRQRHREMAYYIRHDVDVYKVKNQNSPSVRKVMTRSINLVDVGAEWCRHLVGYKDIPTLLASHAGSLRMIYAFSLFFRAVHENFMRRSVFRDASFPSGNDLGVAGIEIHELTGEDGGSEAAVGWGNVRFTQDKYTDEHMGQINPPAGI